MNIVFLIIWIPLWYIICIFIDEDRKKKGASKIELKQEGTVQFFIWVTVSIIIFFFM